MSASITLRNTMARGTDAVSSFVQYAMMVVGLLFILGIGNVFFSKEPMYGREESERSELPFSERNVQQDVQSASEAFPSATMPRLSGALDYVKRRYRVSPEALLPVFEEAESIGQERRIDPLLILAIIGVESGFNPFAESAMGARGLMQVIPRFHMDKLPQGVEGPEFFDPSVNIRVGVRVLEEAIRRRGGLVAGLQYYAGSSDPAGSYANKVLAEKARLEKASR